MEECTEWHVHFTHVAAKASNCKVFCAREVYIYGWKFSKCDEMNIIKYFFAKSHKVLAFCIIWVVLDTDSVDDTAMHICIPIVKLYHQKALLCCLFWCLNAFVDFYLSYYLEVSWWYFNQWVVWTWSTSILSFIFLFE